MAVTPVKEFEVHPYVQFMMDKYSPYKKWIESEGVPIVGGAFVKDVRTEKLAYWKRKDCQGAICTFSDQMVADAYIAEIAPGKSMKPQRQLYEEIITVAAGRGATTYGTTALQTRSRVGTGSTSRFRLTLAPASHASGSEPCRYFALTSQPVAFELFRDPEFIYDTHYMFKDRFDPGDPEFFSKDGQYFTEYYAVFSIPTSFPISERSTSCRGKARQGHAQYVHSYSGSAMLAHVSQFPWTLQESAPPWSRAHVFLLDSTGYTLMWNEEKSRRDTTGTKDMHFTAGRYLAPALQYRHGAL